MGFPSPAEDFKEQGLDLNRYLIEKPSSTFFMKSVCNMPDAGITAGDLLVIDRSLNLYNNDLAICYINGEFLLKRILKTQNSVWLVTDKEDCKPVAITPENEVSIGGIVKGIIKKLR